MKELNHPGLPFVIDAAGWFEPSAVQVRSVADPRPTTDALEYLIDCEWKRRHDEASRAGRLLFNGPMLRYVAHEVVAMAGGPLELRMTVGPTCYRDFVGTNLFNHDRLAEFGWRRFSNPIGTTATLVTTDGLICYGLRSWRVAYHASHVHTFGGCLEVGDRREDGVVDPFASVAREIHEELNILPNELSAFGCVGLLRDREIHQPEMLFDASVQLNAAEVRERWSSAEARDEHDDLITVPDEPGAIVPFIRGCRLIAPVAVGALLLHGMRVWGRAWYDGAARDLSLS